MFPQVACLSNYVVPLKLCSRCLMLTGYICCFFSYTFKECFVPISELSNLKQFTGYIDLVFPGAALFLVCTEEEFKHFFMELITAFLLDEDCCSVYGAWFVVEMCQAAGMKLGCSLQQLRYTLMEAGLNLATQFVWLTTPGSEQSVSQSL